VAGRKQPATYNAQRMSVSHTYGGRCCFITILIIMISIKNFTRECMASLSGASLKLQMQEGGEA
jgi:hypothetical protein